MNYEEKIKLVSQIPILEVAGRLGVNVISNTCTRCLHPKNKKSGSHIEFNIKENNYRCPCLSEKGNVIELVENVLNIDTEEAVKWLYEEFHLTIYKS